MHITAVNAYWLQCPIPPERQHVSDFGRLTTFDMTLIEVQTNTGLTGYGEAKAAVGSAGSCASLVACVDHELKPLLLGQDPRQITRLWERMYNGSRAHFGEARGRSFPVLGRRGLTVAALGGVDMALWDLLGKIYGVPVTALLGGACCDTMPAYASGGWADVDGIGPQLASYVAHGFKAVKMRVGVMDGTVANSIARVRAARAHLGPDIKIMADAHGTYSVPEAQRFCQGTEDCHLYWFEEPINADNKSGTAAVRASTATPIAAGESEFTRYDIRDLIALEAIDVVQPDAAIIGGITETMRVGTLAHTYGLEMAPHLWGSALSFMAGLHAAFASPAATILEFSLGANPMLHDLVEETLVTEDGFMHAPERPGLGLTPRPAFIAQNSVALH